MSKILRRLKLSFQHRARQNLETRTSPGQQDTGRPQATNEDDSNNRMRSNGTRSPSPLPVITDCGPPAAHRYENEDIFWNSTMIEADRDPEKHQALSKRQTQLSASQESLNAMGPTVRGHARNLGPGVVRAEIKRTPPNVRQSTTDGTQQHSKVPQTPARENNDITVMLAQFPHPPSSLAKPPGPPQPPTSRKEEWNAFMDFPSDCSMHIYRNACGNRHILLPKHTNGEAAISSTIMNTNGNLSSPSSETRPVHIENGAPEALAREAKLSWDFALHQILEHDCVDPAVKEVIRERMRASQATNGRANSDDMTTSAVAAGLVPSFSYPVAGSEFYEKVPVQSANSPSLNIGTIDQTEGFEEPKITATLTNGICSNDTCNRSSTESDSDESDYGSTLSSEPPDRVYYLLSSQLTPSELSLHHRILNIVPPLTSPFPSTTLPSNAFSSTPREERLICKLHDTITGLQDRISGLEDSLIPQLSTWLERKSTIIEELKVDMAILNNETAYLKKTIDFGNRILGGCWQREGALYETLLDLRVKRNKTPMRQWIRGSRGVQNSGIGDTNPSNMLNGTHAETTVEHPLSLEPITPQTPASNGTLSKRELSALFDIAAQNIRVLKEDIDEMVTLVQGYKAMAERKLEVDPVPGSWRDV